MVKLVSEKNTEFENSLLSEVHVEFSNIVSTCWILHNKKISNNIRKKFLILLKNVNIYSLDDEVLRTQLYIFYWVVSHIWKDIPQAYILFMAPTS